MKTNMFINMVYNVVYTSGSWIHLQDGMGGPWAGTGKELLEEWYEK